MFVNGYRCMWVVVMFDLPVDTAPARRAYTQFRKRLLKDGFTMMQYSVYLRHCASQDSADVHVRRVGGMVPDEGEIRIITITDKQFERMHCFWGKKRHRPEEPPQQLELF